MALNRMKLHYQRSGSGQPLVIVHGLFGSSDNWRTVAKHCASHATVITLDLRNHGRSPHHPEMTYPVMAEDIAELMQDLDIEQADMLGHSIGGKVVMTLSEMYPHLIRRMGIVDIAPKRYPPAHTVIIQTLRALDLSQFQQRRELDAALSGAIPDKAVRQFLLMNVEGRSPPFRWRINLPAIEQNYPELLKAVCQHAVVHIPTCFIRGGRSSYITDEDEAGMRRIFPQSEIHTVQDAGHWVHADSPAAFLATINAFFYDD